MVNSKQWHILREPTLSGHWCMKDGNPSMVYNLQKSEWLQTNEGVAMDVRDVIVIDITRQEQQQERWEQAQEWQFEG